MKKAVLFDLDDTLVPTHDLHMQSWEQLANDEDIPLQPQDKDRLRGLGRAEALNLLLLRVPRVYTPAERQALAQRKNHYYKELLAAKPLCTFPCVPELLSELDRRGIRTAIASSSKNAHEVAELTGLTRLVRVVLSGNDVRRAKPDPEVFLKAAEQLGVRPDECLVVEDAPAGIQAARTAGMAVFGIGSPEVLFGVQEVATSISEVTADWLLAAGERQTTG